MKSFLRFLSLTAAAVTVLAVVSCRKVDVTNTDEGVVTDACQLKSTGVVLVGKGITPLDASAPWSAYFLLSKKAGVLKDPSALRLDATIGEGAEFSATWKDYEPSVTYYFVALAEQGGKTYKGKEMTFVAPVSGVTLDQKQMYLFVGEEKQLTATVSPDFADQDVTWTSGNPSVAAVDVAGTVTGKSLGTTYVTATARDGLHTARCEVICREEVPAGAVDMGLSVYWSKCNLGAVSESQAGSYYAYGDTKTRTEYNVDNYEGKYVASNSANPYPSLAPEYDAAHVRLGGKWRMPTYFEAMDLRDNCTVAVEKDGVRLTSKITHQSLFFPFNGYYNGSTLTATSEGYLRTSSNYSANRSTSSGPDVITISFNSAGLGVNFLNTPEFSNNGYIYYGMNIRPVYAF